MMQVKNIGLGVGLSLILVSAVYAGVDSGTSNSSYIVTGSATGPVPHDGGLVTSSLTSTIWTWQFPVGFVGMQNLVPGTFKKTVKTHWVTDVPNTWLAAIPYGHIEVGNYSFSQVPVSYEVFYGEWASRYAATGTAKYEHTSHTVYYGGDNTGRTIPLSGTATYAARGMNGYNASSSNLLEDSTLTVNFATAKLNGTLINGTASTKTITFNNVTVNLATGEFNTSFGGTVTGTKQNNTSITGGTAKGHLFGHNGSTATGSFAGIVKFTEHVKYDTAVGGKQTGYSP